jgi:hypothetical protein
MAEEKEYTLDQLRDMAIAEAQVEPAAPAAPAAESERPRDESGRFVAAAPAVPEPEPEPEPEVFRREIDLGDGSGKQVFEGASWEELADKLANAQMHATRKIRELSQPKKEEPVPSPATVEMTEDERWLISQEFLTDPDKAFDKLVEKRLLPKLQPQLEKIKAIERQEQAEVASNEFVSSHPDYYATPKNGEKLVRYLNTWKMDATVENLEKAFQDLSESGLLEPKPAPNAENVTEETVDQRIAKPGEVVRSVRKVASGLSARRSVPAPVPQGPTEEELSKLSLEQLRDLAYRAVLSPEKN